MRSSINNELGYTELTIEESIRYEEDYQMHMLRECKLEGLIAVVGYGVDERSQYIYDVSGMQNIKQLYEKEPMSEKTISEFCSDLLSMMDRIKQHMLDVNKVLLDPQYIFKNASGYQFCYYPINKDVAKESFHSLTEYFVKAIDYNHINSVRLVCGLHKSTMDEQYDLTEVLERYSDIECVGLTEQVLDIKPNLGEIWACDMEHEDDELEISKEKETKEGRGGEYKFPKDIQVSSLLKETAVGKWWGRRNEPSTNGEGQVKVRHTNKEKWGDWESLLKEELP